MAADIKVLRHSCAHVLAEAVVSLFPKAKPTIGPVVEEGFYYDFYHKSFTPEDLKKIEKKMNEIIKRNGKFKRMELKKQEALKMFKDNKYKIELIKELPKGETISAYKQGKFVDLCRGPHVKSTGEIKAFKLIKLAGAYWRGDSKREQLQRIYGIAFGSKQELKRYETLVAEAEKRDHRKIGKALDLFSFYEEGPGFPFWHPKGMVLYNQIVNYWGKVHQRDGYGEIKTPIILNQNLWHQSGHWDHYKENMYFTEIDGKVNAVKPMNCPGGMLIYKEKIHSYREFPIKNAELGLVHRHELSGVLMGLFRVRAFTQDDAHVFCLPGQVEEELIKIINLVKEIYETFGFKDYHIELSTRPEKHIGDIKVWDNSEKIMKNALKKGKISHKVNEGEGAFYGPKFDFHIKDCIGRNWQCATIQLDFSMPERFDLTYEGEDGRKHRPIMIHRAILGSFERFIGILIEHYAGKFPLWLSPVQVILLPIADRHKDYCFKVADKMKEAGLRIEVDDKAETTNKKIRNAQKSQIKYILVVGDAEVKNKTVNVRTRDSKVHGEKKVDVLIKSLLKEVEEKK